MIAGPDGEFGTSDDLPPQQRFMVLTRATNRPGPDGQLGTSDDVHEATNNDTPWVDQNQTYGSHPVATGLPPRVRTRWRRPTGVDRTADPGRVRGHGDLGRDQAQAADLLGIELVDADVTNVPLLVTDPYGRFVRGPNGFPLLVTTTTARSRATRRTRSRPRTHCTPASRSSTTSPTTPCRGRG